MGEKTDTLREIFLDVADKRPTLTERQEEEPSHDPIEERDAALEDEVTGFVRDDGLDDAVDGADVAAG